MTLDEEIRGLEARLHELRRKRANGQRSAKQIGVPRKDATRAKIAAGMREVWRQRKAAGYVSSKPHGPHPLTLATYVAEQPLL
jgi:hypothetical protein